MTTDLRAVARDLVKAGHGILAADESIETCNSRLAKLGLDTSEESRRSYREVLVCAPGTEAYVSGVILFDETIRQAAADGTPFADVLQAKGILPGVKVDTGAKPMAGAPGETVTEGLDRLRERVGEYRCLGARFAKWRAVHAISEHRPTVRAIRANAHALARYAALCQEGGLVPVVEPELLMSGAHSLASCKVVTREVLTEVFSQLEGMEVDLEAIVLKPAMVLPGADADPADEEEIAAATTECLSSVVPGRVAGIAFLSGGQAPDQATRNLEAIVRRGPHPWPITFSFGRAIQDDVLRTWNGRQENVPQARAALLDRLRANAAATRGPSTRSSGISAAPSGRLGLTRQPLRVAKAPPGPAWCYGYWSDA